MVNQSISWNPPIAVQRFHPLPIFISISSRSFLTLVERAREREREEEKEWERRTEGRCLAEWGARMPEGVSDVRGYFSFVLRTRGVGGGDSGSGGRAPLTTTVNLPTGYLALLALSKSLARLLLCPFVLLTDSHHHSRP